MADIYSGPNGPIGVYADATGVVDATAAAEIVALGVILKGFLPDGSQTPTGSEATPDFDQIPIHTSLKLRAEIDALLAAVAAAPTV